MTNRATPPENLPTPLRAVAASLTAGPGSPTASGGGPKVNPIFRYWNAVKRVKWLVLLLTMAGLGGGAITSRLRPAEYVIHSELQIAPSDQPTFQQDQWKVYLTTYSILEPVAIQRHMYIIGPARLGAPPLPHGPSGPAAALFNGFTPRADYVPSSYRLELHGDGSWKFMNMTSGTAEHGVRGDSIGRTFGFQWLPQIEPSWLGKTFDFQVVTTREAADDVKNRLDVAVVPWQNPRFIQLTMTGQDRATTEGVLNDIMQRFVTEVSRTKKHDVTEAAQALDSQLVLAKAKLEADDRSLQQFQIKTITLPRAEFQVAPGLQSTTPGAYSSYVAKRSQVDEYRKQRRDLATALAKLETGQGAADLYAMNPVTKLSPELMAYVNELVQDELEYQTLRQRFSDSMVDATGKVDMPRLLANIKRLRTITVPTYTRTVLGTLDGLIARADSEVAAEKDELQNIPQRSIQESEFQRDKSVQEAIVADLTKSYYTAKSREVTSVPDVMIVDAAVAPLQPTKNRSAIIIALGAAFGLGAGLGLALLLDVTDKRVRYAEQVTSGLGLTILGVIPEIRRAKGEQPSAEEAAQVIEAFRTVRLNLAHSLGEGSAMLTISSPSPGDGKSLVSSNLALSFAESGYRTLLIDGDSRRGELHRTFGSERRPGLLDYLAGELPMTGLVRNTSHEHLQLIPGGSRKRNAPELLGTARMRDLLATMRERFDVVIVDTPPLGAGIDPFVLATLTGSLMLVLRAGATESDLAEAKLQIIDQLPIRLVGAVLNDVRASMNDYKYYSYSYGYSAVDEAPVQGSLTATTGATARS
jgi:capsular exopolysaccharide synthesis family protein